MEATASGTLSCAQCDASFTQTGRGPKRTYCYECRPAGRSTSTPPSDLWQHVSEDGFLTAPFKDCGQPLNRQLKRKDNGEGWNLKGRPRYCHACIERRAQARRKRTHKRAQQRLVGTETKWVRDCLTCGQEFVSVRVPGKWGTRHCEPCTVTGWACQHCGDDTRQTSRLSKTANRRGHITWPTDWGKATCDACKHKVSRADRVASLQAKRQEKAKPRVFAKWYAHNGCQSCGNPEPYVARGPNIGCSEECSKRIMREMHQHRRKMAFRKAPEVEVVMPGRVYRRDRGICQLCGDVVPPPGAVPANSANAAQLDHIVPMSDPYFGSHTYENMRLTHAHCNNMRQAPRRNASYRRAEPLRPAEAA